MSKICEHAIGELNRNCIIKRSYCHHAEDYYSCFLYWENIKKRKEKEIATLKAENERLKEDLKKAR